LFNVKGVLLAHALVHHGRCHGRGSSWSLESVFQDRSGFLDDHFRLDDSLVDRESLLDDVVSDSVSVNNRLDFFNDCLSDGLLDDWGVDDLGSRSWSSFYSGRLNHRNSVLDVTKLSGFGRELSFFDSGWHYLSLMDWLKNFVNFSSFDFSVDNRLNGFFFNWDNLLSEDCRSLESLVELLNSASSHGLEASLGTRHPLALPFLLLQEKHVRSRVVTNHRSWNMAKMQLLSVEVLQEFRS